MAYISFSSITCISFSFVSFLIQFNSSLFASSLSPTVVNLSSFSGVLLLVSLETLPSACAHDIPLSLSVFTASSPNRL
ncbi:hypothetical protein PGT21_006577 [Puccinia graminis f. sp. tritici]|uniref:Uncharacterized protein n=1 Tax=Puccinia graminis f. sp. tritici TaxID=56615 RepID=A0A5B0LUD6_PUCGR|nr:hypothetical protein PGT21_006577 [Puccinia graminis f. sp. tritici]